MLTADKDSENKNKSGVVLVWEASALPQAREGTQPAGTLPKLKAERFEQKSAATRDRAKGTPYQGPKTHWATYVGKAAEAKDPSSLWELTWSEEASRK